MKTRLPERSVIVKPVLEKLSKAIRDHYQHRLKYLLLYGSYARGNFNDESDVDILVVLDDIESVMSELDALTLIKFDMMLEHEKFISTNPVSENRFLHSEEPYFKNIHKEGIAL